MTHKLQRFFSKKDMGGFPDDFMKEELRKAKENMENKNTGRKIYDCFCFFNELQTLELRLNILDPVVDYFVICESSVTHTGLRKPFYYGENKERFEKFAHKIIHVKVTDTPDKFGATPNVLFTTPEANRIWKFIGATTTFNRATEPHYGRDFWQKECIGRGLVNCNDEDIIISSDCDEIPNPEVLKKLDTFFDPEKFYSFQQNSYYYYLNMLKETDWFGSRMGTYGKLKNYSFNELRRQTNTPIPNGGWHFSFQGGLEKVKTKIESYSAVDMNTDYYKNNLSKNINEGIDPFERSKLTEVPIDETFPEYLRKNIDLYGNMIKNHTQMEHTQPQSEQKKTEQGKSEKAEGLLVSAKEASSISMSFRHRNFIVISNYNEDPSWIKKYPNDYIIYDRSDDGRSLGSLKVIKSKNVGYNLADYFTFIIDNYDKLPEYTTFCKGNIFPRHMSEKRFEELVDNQCFTPLFDHSYEHQPKMPVCMFSCDGAWSEINNGISLPDKSQHPTKYISSYNDLLKFCFTDALIPQYITFAAGGNYVVPRNNILKYTKTFYQNLRFIISHHQLSGESHLVERALYTIWMCNFKPNPKFNDVLVNEATFAIREWSALTTRNVNPPQKATQVAAGKNPSDYKNMEVLCTIKLKEAHIPFYPPAPNPYVIDAKMFELIFEGMRFEDCSFTQGSQEEAEAYLSSVLFPRMKGQANATFIIDKTYKRK